MMLKKKTTEEYIEAIYNLKKKHDYVHTCEIANAIGVAPPTVTEMMQKLDSEGLVNYVPYHGVALTATGEKMAKDLLLRHKTLAEFLKIIGVDRKNADIDACQIEHHVSPRSMKQLNKFVKFVDKAPQDPRWLEHFKHYCRTGERQRCEKRD
jgi:DtxR family Mn-dependent transcriptional regulator